MLGRSPSPHAFNPQHGLVDDVLIRGNIVASSHGSDLRDAYAPRHVPTSLRYARAASRPSLGNSCIFYVVRRLTIMALTLHGSRSFLCPRRGRPSFTKRRPRPDAKQPHIRRVGMVLISPPPLQTTLVQPSYNPHNPHTIFTQPQWSSPNVLEASQSAAPSEEVRSLISQISSQ